jgi:hypothetical protein
MQAILTNLLKKVYVDKRCGAKTKEREKNEKKFLYIFTKKWAILSFSFLFFFLNVTKLHGMNSLSCIVHAKRHF